MIKHIHSFAFTLLIILICSSLWGQTTLFTEHFDYTAGHSLTDHGWTQIRSGSTPMTITSSGLTYPDEPFTGVGNALSIVSSGGQEVKNTFAEQTADSFYVSFLINLNDASSSSSGGLFLYAGPTDISIFNRGLTAYVKKDGSNNIAFGIAKNSGIGYTGFNYSLNTTYLIVMKYKFNPGVDDDEVSLWIDPSLSGSEPAPDRTTSSGSDATSFAEIVLSQLTLSNEPPDATIDEVIVKNRWVNYIDPPLVADSLALVAIYNSTDGPNWTNPWDLDQPVSTWDGITIGGGDRVTIVWINGKGLSGPLPAEIGNLTSVTHFYLYDNQLSGTIPSTIEDMTSLRYLWLYNNQLSGAIPIEMMTMTTLLQIRIDRNQFTGSIPTQIGALSNLEQLNLEQNDLSGSIPTEIEFLTDLNILDLADNQLTGSIPTQIGLLTELTEVTFGSNLLTGTIPAGIGNAPNMRILNLENNNLTGPIPSTIGQLDLLEQLYLNNNSLSGPIPDGISNLTVCRILGLENNQLDDVIPAGLGSMTALNALSLQNNNFEGDFPVSVAGLSSIQHIYMQNNRISGLPDLSGASLPDLQNLIVYDNRLDFADIEPNLGIASATFSYDPQGLVGEVIDTTINNGSNFNISVDVGGANNQYQWFKGVAPISGENSSTFSITSIQTDDEGSYRCEITNTVVTDLTLLTNPVNVTVFFPPLQRDSLALVALYNSTNGAGWTNNTNWLTSQPLDNWYGIALVGDRVTDISLFNNNLSGTIPVQIGDLSELTNLYLSSNDIGGTIPAEIGNLTNLTSLNIGSNDLAGQLPAELGQLENMISFIIPTCNLSGSIPPIFENMTDLRVINIGYNNFSGSIPAGIGLLPDMQQINMQHNALSGSIPEDLFNSTTIWDINLMYNQLTGPIPSNIGTMNPLRNLILLQNQLSGNIPSTIGNLTNLEQLYLSDNDLSGSIPASIGNLILLENLALQGNQLNGSIPTEIEQLTVLTDLNLRNNMLSGAIPEEIGGCTSLTYLNIQGNQLNGPLPAALGLLVDMDNLLLDGNNINGPIPPEIVNMSSLRNLVLFNNQLEEAIPADLGLMTNLEIIELQNNNLIGDFPSSVAGLNAIQSIHIENNQISGLPDLSALVSLQDLIVQNNKLTFEDIEPNLGVASNSFSYSPQDSIGENIDTTLTAGDDLVLTINVGGANNQYQWFKDNNPISEANSNILTISSVDFNDTGAYTCQITNTLAGDLTLTTRPFNVVVPSPPQVTTNSVTAISTTSVTLNGTANANGLSTDVNFIWGVNPDLSTATTVAANQSPVTGATDTAVDITLSDLLPETTYYFQVSAENGLGTVYGDTLSFSTLAPGSAPTVATLEASLVLTTSALLNGTVNPNDDQTIVEFEVDGVTTVAAVQSPLNGTNNQTVDAAVTGLSPNTQYQYRVNASNSAGTSNGNWVVFTTLQQGIGITAITLPAENITVNSATLNGSINPNNLTPTTHFQWGTEATYGNITTSDQGLISGNSAVPITVDITSLSEHTSYHYRVLAVNLTDTTFGLDEVFSTLYGPVTLNSPANSATELTVTPTLSWNAITGVTQYRVQVATDVTFSNFIIDETVSATSFNATLTFGTTFYWRVAAFESAITHTWSDTWTLATESYPEDIPVTTTVTFEEKTDKSSYRATDYKLFGLPGNSDLPLANIFGSDSDQWIAYWDNGQAGSPEDYLVSYAVNNTFRFRTGRAFWIIYNGQLQVNQTIDNSSVNNNNEIEIPLHSGWNLITNPLPTSINWTDIQNHNGFTEPLNSFNGSFTTTTNMETYRGYYFFNDPSLSMSSIMIPVVTPASKTAFMAKDNYAGWQASIEIESNDLIKSYVHWGVSETATSGKDIYDYHKPRAIGEIPGAYFERFEWDNEYPVFGSDIRSPFESSESWSFKVHSGRRSNLQLTAFNIEQIPAEYEVYLLDYTREKFINLRESAIYRFSGIPNISNFEVLVGNRNTIENKIEDILPRSFVVGLSFPNPFNPITTIPISVPKARRLKISVFDTMGRLVKAIYSGDIDAGKHFFNWNGTDQNGNRVSSGIYIFRVISNNNSMHSGKLILLK